ncbi:MAG: hypothetical protein KJZ80_10360 [Hyphomicrobiaceae bacterium]|nr:hypothetical protein [Hyphomicrobiaceae bacterium]
MMFHRFAGLMAVAATGCLAVPALAGEAATTRIEPRVFYGATVTLEEGVRVFRPLPPHKQVIINPDSRTPVSLSFNEYIEKRHDYEPGDAGYVPDALAPDYHGGAALPFAFGKFHKDKFKKPRFGMFPSRKPSKRHHGFGPR